VIPESSDVAMGCAGCSMHKGPRRSEWPLAAKKSIVLNHRKF